ncbi:hypothetical protein PsorP6_010419 [Peronosclerospora sorghi]|uniref:Uncharacterized protein n=1 Tax=Peronosclerospora sorghi TaxID=230839 RepID=A0ACC0VTX9_9STRA|nr:hypothetical protein PsorP6_010419 [Peronosclerospora sorghi]
MAAKFSMANSSGLFDAAAHVEASDRMHGAMDELKMQHKQRERIRQRELEEQEREENDRAVRLKATLEANAAQANDDRSFVGHEKSNDDELVSDDEDLLRDNDPELERLVFHLFICNVPPLKEKQTLLCACRIRMARLEQLKQEYEERKRFLSQGHGEYHEITQDAFLQEVTSSRFVVVHFFHGDFERCKLMDMHLTQLARSHMECKFLKLNAEKAPFFVHKLAVRVLPTLVAFKDGVAFSTRVIGFEGLTELNEATDARNCTTRSSDHFSTAALARKLVEIGAIRERTEEDEERT